MNKPSRIKKTIKGLLTIAKNPWLLNNVLSDNSVWAEYIQKKYNITGGLKAVDIWALFPDFKETLDTFAFLDGGSSALDLSLIKALCKTVPNCTYFEIGTCRGESVANVAGVCSQCYTMDLEPIPVVNRKSSVVSLKGEESPTIYDLPLTTDLIGFFSKNLKNVTQIFGDSSIFDFAALGRKFDVVFIDGDHRYEFVKSDTSNVFNHLVHENSIVIWHDYATDILYPRNEVFAGILDGVPAALHKNLYHVSNTICAVYINKQLRTIEAAEAHIPNKKLKISIQAESI